jgi:sulfite exporter TauE/SafE
MIFLWVAFTLGFTGSLHCMGMCGPLAFTMCSGNTKNSSILSNSILYHTGRIITYILLGSIIGMFSHLMLMSGVQKGISIISGMFLIALAIFSSSIDSSLSNNGFGRWMGKISGKLHSSLFQKMAKPPVIILGVLNGILPCGLVYVALTGATSSGNLLSGAVFMAFFGLGTLPLLLFSTYYSGKYSLRFPNIFQRLLPGITIILGLMMILRGFLINTPLTLNFADALRNPVLCH